MRRRKRHITATELASLATCEYKTMLDYWYGKGASTKTKEQRRAGQAEHDRHHKEATRWATKPAATEDKRCFVATELYGPDAMETRSLRSWRDTTLSRLPFGAVLISIYYRISPGIAEYLHKHRWARWIVRKILNGVVRWIR